LNCLRRWEKVRIYFHKLIVIKKFELLKEKTIKVFGKLKLIIKKKKNEQLLKEKMVKKFDYYHNKIPIENINSWKYNVAFQNLYIENNDILKIFKLKDNYTIVDLRNIMNIHKFSLNDWNIWCEIVVNRKGEINDLPTHLLNYYKYLENNKKDKENKSKNINYDKIITYEKNFFDEKVTLTNNREKISCPKEIENQARFYDLIMKDFFNYDEVVELITMDEKEIKDKQNNKMIEEKEIENAKNEKIAKKYLDEKKIIKKKIEKI